MSVGSTEEDWWRWSSVCIPVDVARGRFQLQRGLFWSISPQAPIWSVLWGPAARFGDIRGYSHQFALPGVCWTGLNRLHRWIDRGCVTVAWKELTVGGFTSFGTHAAGTVFWDPDRSILWDIRGQLPPFYVSGEY